MALSVEGAAGGGPDAAPSASLAAWRSRQVGLLPARARRGGPDGDGRSVDSVRAGGSAVRMGAVRSGMREVRPAFLAASLRSASSSRSRCFWATLSSSL